jgi:hypothetical protein
MRRRVLAGLLVVVLGFSGWVAALSATLENEADPTLENEATGSSVSSLLCFGF